MPCEGFDERLQAILDERGCPEEDARLCEMAELDEEFATRMRLAEMISSSSNFALFPAPVCPSADFADRILAQLREEDAAEVRRKNAPLWQRSSFWISIGSMASAACLVVVLNAWLSGGSADLMAARQAEEASPAAQEQTQQMVAENSSGSVEPSGSSWENDRKTLATLSKDWDVRNERVALLRDGFNPLRSTFYVTLHVLKSTVPNRPHAEAPRSDSNNQQPLIPSSAILSPRWVA